MPYKDPEIRRLAAKECSRAFYLANKEQIRARCKAYYEKDIEQSRALARKRYHEKYRIRILAKTYGVTKEEIEKVLAVGVCEICKTKEKTLNIDHDHKTKKIRGLLCHSCNNGLGRFADNPEWLRQAAAYIEDRKG